MNFSFLSLFKKKTQPLKNIDSIFIKNLKELCRCNAMFVYENITLYHHAQSLFVPLLILDPVRGIYLFEYKSWSYNDLKNATISQAKNQESSTKSVAFDKTHDFIRKRFNELTHSDGVALFNFLLMENLSTDEYEHLDISFQKLLPKNKIIFNNLSHEDIMRQFHLVAEATSALPDVSYIMGNLLVQYLILSKHQAIHFASTEQIDFINSEITQCQTLKAKAGSGKTSVLLLKVILEKLRNPNKSVMIIAPTTIACDILKQRLLATVEYAIIEVDITSIEIITPTQLLNRHLCKLKKNPLGETFFIENALMDTPFKCAELILCDDSDLLSESFIHYLRHIQKKSHLLLVSSKSFEEGDYIFEKSFRQENQSFIFKKANPHAKTLQIISKLLCNNPKEEVLVISNSLNKEKLNDDLKFFIRAKAVLLDSSKNLVNQEINTLLLTTYEDLSGINAKFVLLLDAPSASKTQLDYAAGLCEEICYVIYEEESENIEYLRKKYED